MRARWLVLCLVVLAIAAPRATAQSASVQAQSLFNEGRTLMQAGKIAEACVAFESSQQLDPAVTTQLNLADCREQNHQLATAWGIFVDANRAARASKDAKLARVASNHARKLEPRLSKLTIAVPADRQIAGLEVLRGNDLVNPASWNHALPIDGGTYTLTARAPGRTPWSATRTIKVEGDRQTIEIPKLAEAKPVVPIAGVQGGTPAGAAPTSLPTKPETPAATAIRTGGPAGTEPPPVAAGHPSTAPGPTSGSTSGSPVSTVAASARPASAPSRTLPLVVGAGALVLGGAAVGFHLWGNRLYDDAKDEMRDQAKRDDLEKSANTRRYLAQGFGVAAIGCAGAAVYLYLRGRGEGRADTTAMTPIASPQFAGLGVVGRW